MRNNKLFSIFILFIIYSFTVCLSILLYNVLPFETVFIKLLILDIIATVIIFIFSLILKNASVYDPYWSVVPPILAISYCFLNKTFNPIIIGAIVIICVWSIRLTFNCLLRFKNLNHQDWRYTMLKNKFPKFYFFINLFGIHLFPTLIVFFAMLPFFEVCNLMTGSFMSIISLVVMAGAVVLCMIADFQMELFKKRCTSEYEILDKGLWKVSRHPNYFGEVLFWFGIYLLYYSCPNVQFGSLIALLTSPLSIFCLFEFISVPMMDKYQLNKKPNYKQYMDKTNPLLIIFPPKSK